MKEKITLEIECGVTTCASKPGEFCEFLILGMGHRKQTCIIFGQVDDKDGWIQRHKNCMANCMAESEAK